MVRQTLKESFLVTDLALFSEHTEQEAEEASNPAGYLAATMSNIAFLLQHGVVPQGGWDVFCARDMWSHSRDPDIVVLHGFHYNTVEEAARTSQGAWDADVFKAMAASALRAQFPSSLVIFLHTETHLDFYVEGPNLTAKVLPGSNIDNWCAQTRFPDDSLHARLAGPGVFRQSAPFLVGDDIDVLGLISTALHKRRLVLQLAANRCQLSKRIVETFLSMESVAEEEVPEQHLPLPRKSFYAQEGQYVFTYMNLLEWGRTRGYSPAGLASYWLEKGYSTSHEPGFWPRVCRSRYHTSVWV